jgi:hypothetical protein
MWASTDNPELDDALRELGRARFVFHEFGEDALAAVHDWGGTADVLIIGDSPSAATAYRTPSPEGLDPFAPLNVLWIYASDVLSTVRALLGLPSPAAEGAPSKLIPAPPGIGLSAQWRADRSLRVRMRPH